MNSNNTTMSFMMNVINRRGWNAIESRLIQDLENFVPKESIGEHQVAY